MGIKKYYCKNGDLKNVYNITMNIDECICTYEEFKCFQDENLYFHGFFEVMLMRADHIRMLINDKSYVLNKNDLIIFSPQDFHRYVLEEGQVYCRLSCEFSHEYIYDYCTENSDLIACFSNRTSDYCPIRHLEEKDAQTLIKLMKTALHTQSSNKYGDDVTAKCAITRMLILVNQLFKKKPKIDSGEVLDEYQKLKPVVNYINTHLNEELTLDNLTKKFYISKYHLCRIFKQTFGFTVNEYITYRRVLGAVTLLRNGCSVMQACEQVTPDGISHFISVFKKLMGTTPKQYAKQYQT